MAFLVNLGYEFKIPETVEPDGSIILASTMPMHQLERRRIDKRYPHMSKRLFDPQLYQAALDASASTKHCAKLATYPWFGVSGLDEYKSSAQTQAGWTRNAKQRIASIWPGRPPRDPGIIHEAVRECIDFQHRLECMAIILPSPLTVNPGTDYAEELLWLDSALSYVEKRPAPKVPVYATVALTDTCVRFLDPPENPLLDLILDTVSAREVDGVYLTLEQASEPADSRHCGSTRALQSLLHLVHHFSADCGLHVGVNFLGAFGLACEAAGAEFWASGWYKSVYRFRLADKIAGGRAYPSYWTYPAALDVHLEKDLDALRKAGLLARIGDKTIASSGLLLAAEQGQIVTNVPAWAYRQANITAAKEHFLLSSVQAERLHSQYSGSARRNFAEKWLLEATRFSGEIAETIDRDRRTKTSHVQAWKDAFVAYRRDHKV